MFLFRRSQSSRKALAAKKAVEDSKKNNENEKDYPTTKLPTFRGDSPFAGATPASGGSWLICEDLDGQPYWMNDVTGQWTYQLFSTEGPSTYLPAEQQQPMAALYSPQYVPTSHPWLVSPAGQYQHAPWSPAVPSLATGWWAAKQEDVNETKTLGGVNEGNWVKYYDEMGRDSWMNTVTGERSSVEFSNVI